MPTKPANKPQTLADQIAAIRADLVQIAQLVAAMPGADRDQINVIAVPSLAFQLHWLECHARAHQPKRLNQ